MNKNILIKNGIILDGNGNEFDDMDILIENGIISSIGILSSNNSIDTIIDATGLTIMPGIVNTHAHTGYKYIKGVQLKGFQIEYLEACINEGVTTIRDEGMLSDDCLEDAINARESLERNKDLPRLVLTGKFFTARNGYGGQAPITVETEEEVKIKVEEAISNGVDMIKTVLEDGLDPSTYGLPKLSDELLKCICNEAHKKGVKVSAHVTQAHNLKRLVDAGIDDAGHMVFDELSDELINEMIQKKIAVVPTLTVSKMIADKYGVPIYESTKRNVQRFTEAGGIIALGDDFIEEDMPWYRLGLPKLEIELLKDAGFSNMQIISIATKNGAIICDLENEIGTIEKDKRADLLIVEGNPAKDIGCINNVRYVIRDGNIIIRRKV